MIKVGFEAKVKEVIKISNDDEFVAIMEVLWKF